MEKSKFSRRDFLTTSAVLSAGSIVAPSLISAPNIIHNYGKYTSKIKGVQIGVITYSFRSMEDQSAEATLQYVLDSGISAIELMGGPAESFAGCPENKIDFRAFWGLRRKQRNGETLNEEEQKQLDELMEASDAYNTEVQNWRKKVSMEKFEKFRKMYKDAGVTIYGFKPNAFGKNNTDAEIDYGFRAAKALGASHVTLEHPSDDVHTLKLGKMASKHGVLVAYHGHEQQTSTFWDTALEQSKFNAMNPDMGHYIAAGNENPLDLLNKYHDRICSVHMKDRQTPENGKSNLVWGNGDTPLGEILNLIKDKSYSFPATIELEYQIPEGSDAVTEVKKCLEYCNMHLG